MTVLKKINEKTTSYLMSHRMFYSMKNAIKNDNKD